MQITLNDLIKMMWAVRTIKEIREGKDGLSALRHNKYIDEYILSVEKSVGKPFNEIVKEIKNIDDESERLIMFVKNLVLPIIHDEETRKKAIEQAEKIANELRTIHSPKMALYKVLVAVLRDEVAAEALTEAVDPFLKDIEKYINR